MRINDDRKTRKAICSGIIGLIYLENTDDLYEALDDVYDGVSHRELEDWIEIHQPDLQKLKDEVIDVIYRKATLFVRSTMPQEKQLPKVTVTFPASKIIGQEFEDHIAAEDFLNSYSIADRQIDRETAWHWKIILSNDQEHRMGIL